MNSDEIARIAEQVSILMQLDRNRHHVGTEIDMQALANVPDYIASVFEQANAVSSDISPAALYGLVNKRISQMQAQLYMMRLELENRHTLDPASIYTDPMAISAYGERVEALSTRRKTFDFGPHILAYGWFPMECDHEDRTHRWMRPGDVSVACVPHLGVVDQQIVIRGYVLHAEQLPDLTIRAGRDATEARAEIEAETGAETGTGAVHFTATLTVTADMVKSATYLPIEFALSDFRQPNEQDTRLLGANIHEFTCGPVNTASASEEAAAEATPPPQDEAGTAS